MANDVEILPQQAPETMFRRSVLSYGFANFLSRALSFLLVFAYAWILDPASVGSLALIESTAIFLSTAFSGGLDLSAHERLNRNSSQFAPEKIIPILLRMNLKQTIIGSVICCGAVGLIPSHLLPLPRTHLLLAIALGALSSLNQIGLSILQARHHSSAYLRTISISSVTTVVLGLALVLFMKAGIVGVIAGRLAGTALSIGMTRRRFPTLAATAIAGLAAWPLMFYQLLVQALNVGDRFILAAFLPKSEVGKYALAYAAGLTLHYVTLSIWQAWSPQFHSLSQNGESTAKVRAETTAASLEVIATLAMLLCALTLPLVRIFLAPIYLPAAELIPWIAVGYVFHAAFLFFQLPVIQANRLMTTVYVTSCAVIMNVLCNFVLVPRIGVLGAAVATTIGFAAQGLAMLAISQRHEGLPYPMRRLSFFCVLLVVAAMASSTQLSGVFPLLKWLPVVTAALLIRHEVSRWSAIFRRRSNLRNTSESTR